MLSRPLPNHAARHVANYTGSAAVGRGQIKLTRQIVVRVLKNDKNKKGLDFFVSTGNGDVLVEFQVGATLKERKQGCSAGLVCFCGEGLAAMSHAKKVDRKSSWVSWPDAWIVCRASRPRQRRKQPHGSSYAVSRAGGRKTASG